MKATKKTRPSKRAPHTKEAKKSAAKRRGGGLQSLLKSLLGAVAASSGARIVDLTQTLSPGAGKVVQDSG